MLDVATPAAQCELERLTRSIGQEMFARIERRPPLLLAPTWWDERLMESTMAHEAVKIQLFRFIDVLPQLRNPEAVARHLAEYFHEARQDIPAWMEQGLHLLPRRGIAARILSLTARRSAERLARRFIAGSNLTEALSAVSDLRKRKLAFTVDLLGEATISESEADNVQAAYLRLIDGLSRHVNHWPGISLIDRDADGPIPRVNVSVKLSALYSQFDPIDPAAASQAVRSRLRPIFRAAIRNGAFVNIDMEQSSVKDLTLRVFRDILDEPEFQDWTDVGIAIQAYLKSCKRDLAELADWVRKRGAPVWVRLIKGAYWDFETIVAAQESWTSPVYEHKWETDANYEDASLYLLNNRDLLKPAFGSHNVRSIAHAVAAAQMLGVPPSAYEIQMLYGMADPIKDALARMGQRVRVYTPYGELLPGMAYLVRRLLENTANDSFLRASFTEHVPEEKLLMNPTRNAPTAGQTNGNIFDGVHQNDPIVDDTHTFKNFPLLDFSVEANRDAMQAALSDVKKQFGHKVPPIIANKKIETAEWIDSINPSHIREIVGCCGKATPALAESAIAAAVQAFASWRDTATHTRCDYLLKMAEIMKHRRLELAAWEVYECGKAWREADGDVAESIDYCLYYAAQMRRLANPSRRDLPGEENSYLYEPRGVSVVIAPWNFPLAILCGMTTAAIVTGNTVVMKPSEQSAVIGAKLMEIAMEAGLPAGVLNYLPGSGKEIGPTLVEHRDVALVAFTGSRGVGLLLNKQTSQQAPGQLHLKRLIAELGGKNAIIVDDDADMDEAVAGVVASAFGYQGQKCSACSRVIVLESLYDAFVRRVVEATRSLKIAPAEDPSCKIGPLIDAEARKRNNDYIETGKTEATLAYAGDLAFLVNEGYYVAPHIFVDVPAGAVIAQEEIFGPVLAVLKARDLDEALAIANGTSYALTGGIYSRSPNSIERVKREFRVGNLYVNRKITGALVARQPFGGFKLSGIGSKAGGPDYLLQFVWPRTITENTMRRGFAPQASAEALARGDSNTDGE